MTEIFQMLLGNGSAPTRFLVLIKLMEVFRKSVRYLLILMYRVKLNRVALLVLGHKTKAKESRALLLKTSI
jgi:hypothetical protein